MPALRDRQLPPHQARRASRLELLAEVYIEMIGGRQTALGFGAGSKQQAVTIEDDDVPHEPLQRPHPLPSRLDAETIAAHGKLVLGMGDKAIWNRYQN